MIAGTVLYVVIVAFMLYSAFRLDSEKPIPAPHAESVIVSSGIDFFMDYGGPASFENLRDWQQAGKFETIVEGMKVIRMSYLRKGMLWIRFSPPEIAAQDGEVTISLPDPRVRVARLYLEKDGAVQTREWRVDSPDRLVGLSSRSPAFHFTPDELKGSTVWFGYQSLSLLRSVVYVESRRAWETRTERGAGLLLLLSGAVGILGLALIGLGVGLRKLDIAILGLLSLATFSQIFGGAGFMHSMIFPGHQNVADFFAYIPKPLGIGLWIILLCRFTKLSVHAPILDSVLKILVIITALQPVSVGLNLWLGWQVPVTATSAYPVLVTGTVGLGVLAWRIFAGDRQARLFTYCWLPAILGLLLRAVAIAYPTQVNERVLTQDRMLDVILSVFLLAFASIIDLQRRSEQARRKAETAEERFRGFAQIASQGFFEVDGNGKVTNAAGPLTDSLGLEEGSDFAAVISGKANSDDAAAAAWLGGSGAVASVRDLLISFQLAQGRVWYAFSVEQMQANGISGVRGTISDVTSGVQRQQEEAKMNTLVALGELATGVAHEVNNLIHPIINLARRLKARHISDPEGARLADLVVTSGERAGKIVGAVLSNVRSSGAGGIKAPISQSVETALDAIETTFPASVKVSRTIDAAADLKIDAGEMLQVLANLAGNSMRAMKGRGGFSVVLSRSGSDIVLVVEDNGPGIAEEFSDREFVPFVKGGDGSTGLGLSIVAGIVQRWGGVFSIGKRDAGGTRAQITLPGTEAESIA